MIPSDQLQSTRLVVIGLDSADPGLLTRWMDSGDLPVLASLRARGMHGSLRSPPGMADDGTWASFYTGVSPARHGRYFFQAILPGSYRSPFWQDSNLKFRPFWETLSQRGRRLAVIDVPKCPLYPDMNGLHVTDWRVHGRDHNTASQPPEVTEDLLARFGEDCTDVPFSPEWYCDGGALSPDAYDRFVDLMHASVEAKLGFATEVLQQAAWDLFLVVFKEAHCAGHKFFHLLDDNHADYSPATAARFGGTILDVYRHLDDALGKLLTATPSSANVLVFSDLGMAPNYSGNFLLDEILRRLEQEISPVFDRLRRRVAGGFQSLRRRRSRDAQRAASRRYRRFYPLDNGEQCGAIRLNIRGRDPVGMLNPGSETDRVADFLCEELRQLEDPDTATPLVAEVLRGRDVYEGPHLDLLPDLLVMWNRNLPIRAAASPRVGEIRLPVPALRSGGHVADGLYLLAGPTVSHQPQPSPASILDLAPTIAQLLDEHLPGLEGRPITYGPGSGTD